MMFLGLAAAGALAYAGVAAAATHPALIVSNLDPLINDQEVILVVSPKDPPVAKATIYVGAGNVLALRPRLPFGVAAADFQSNADYGSSFFSLIGDVVNANPAAYVHNDCSPGLHAAV